MHRKSINNRMNDVKFRIRISAATFKMERKFQYQCYNVITCSAFSMGFKISAVALHRREKIYKAAGRK